jgi:hypothetical protein
MGKEIECTVTMFYVSGDMYKRKRKTFYGKDRDDAFVKAIEWIRGYITYGTWDIRFEFWNNSDE